MDAAPFTGHGLLPHTQRFHEGNDVPALVHGDGGGQGRLAAVGNAVADLVEEAADGQILDAGAAQVFGLGGETLADRAVTVEVLAVALGAIVLIALATLGNGFGVAQTEGGFEGVGFGRAIEQLSAGERYAHIGHDRNRRFVGLDGRRLP